MTENGFEFVDNFEYHESASASQFLHSRSWVDNDVDPEHGADNRTYSTHSSAMLEDDKESFQYIERPDLSPRGDRVSRDFSPPYAIEQPWNDITRGTVVSHAGDHSSPTEFRNVHPHDFDPELNRMAANLNDPAQSPLFSSGSEHNSTPDTTDFMDTSPTASWQVPTMRRITNPVMTFGGPSNNVGSQLDLMTPMTEPYNNAISTIMPIHNVHLQHYHGNDANSFYPNAQVHDIDFGFSGFPSVNHTLAMPAHASYSNAFAATPSPPQTSEVQASMITHPASNKASTASSPHADFVMIESGNEQISGRKRGRTKLTESQTQKRGYNVFRLTTTSSSESDRSQGTESRAGKKQKGGRRKGSHLSDDKKLQIKERRKETACWTCALQRDQCKPNPLGGPCDRCTKRHIKGILVSSNELGCTSDHLYAYTYHFVPNIFDRLHNSESLQHFMQNNISRFYYENPIHICITPVDGGMPIKCEFYEFRPNSREILVSRAGIHNSTTNKYVHTTKASLPLSMRTLNAQDEKRFDDYFDMLAQDEHYMKRFPAICYSEPPEDFLKRLLAIMVSYKPQGKKETDFVKSVNKLLLLMYSFGRVCEIPDNQQSQLDNMKHHTRASNISTRSLPRMANRQFKFLLLRLLRNALNRVLKSLDNTFRSSTGLWTTAFYGMLGLAMAFEDMENSVAIYLDTERRTRECTPEAADSQLSNIASAIDTKFTFLNKLFRIKHRFNPFVFATGYQNEKRNQKLGEEGARMVALVERLIREKFESYLRFQQVVQVTMENPEMYYGRLVSQFLCSFFGPE